MPYREGENEVKTGEDLEEKPNKEEANSFLESERKKRNKQLIIQIISSIMAGLIIIGLLSWMVYSLKQENESLKESISVLEQTNKANQKYVEMISKLQPRIDKRFIRIITAEIVKNANKYNIKPELIIAIIHRESSFNPISVSNKDCIGLMQINPKVHKEKLKKRDVSYYEASHIGNNIDIGCEILRKYLNKNDNNVRKALKNYVGGNHEKYVNDILNIYANLTVNYDKNKKTKEKKEKSKNGN